MYLTEKDGKVYVDSYAMEVYLPYDYLNKAYQGYKFYNVVGDKVRYYGIGNMRFFKSEKEMKDPYLAKTHPLGIPMIMASCPSDIDSRDVQFVKNGIIRKCIVLTFYKGDVFVDNTSLIVRSDNVMMYFARLDSGKLDHIQADVALGIMQDAQKMNKMKLKVPSEFESIYVAERYQNPAKPTQKIRFADTHDPDKIVSYNFREATMQTGTYQATVGEDINNALIASVNRERKGIVEEPTPMESIVRGLDMSDMIKERDAMIGDAQ